MKYGCIGERLGHSFSKEIHNELADYEYELCEVKREYLCDFAKAADFSAINVTIPYKEMIIPYLYSIDGKAKEIGAVNTVVNRDGRLYGYNTDFYGMRALISHAGITLDSKKVIILGTGGTSKTALAVAGSLGAAESIRVSRDGKEGAITYEELYRYHTDADIIINTTPCGMFPNVHGTPVDISRFTRLSGVIDAIYNPLRSELISAALEAGIPAEGGLYMLVAQAVRASEIFLDTAYDADTTARVFKKLLSRKENIVLTGMPASGKSTVGKILAKLSGRRLVDTDSLITELAGKDIPRIFAEDGEDKFRELESQVIRDISSETSLIIATGGGSVLRPENIRALKQNGRIYFINRPLDKLIPTKSRPLSSDRAAIEKRYRERYGIYTETADVIIDADCSAEDVADKIWRYVI